MAFLALVAFGVVGQTQADTITGTVVGSAPDTDDQSDAPNALSAAASISIEKAAGTPHFWQRDSRGEFENEGRDYCCPVAVSNSLSYLAHHGFPALLPEGSGVRPQIDLIRTLASSAYFGTDPENGTAPGAVLTGVQKYVEEKGYFCARLEYEGWRNIGRNRQSALKASRPDLDWLEQGIHDPNGAVWLNIGWYKQVDDGEWKRTGGHWVTLVGYGATQAGATADPLLLLIDNPATSGIKGGPENLAGDMVRLKTVDEGTLDTGGKSTQDAAGMYQVSGPGLPISSGVDVAFLDAAIVLVIK